VILVVGMKAHKPEKYEPGVKNERRWKNIRVPTGHLRIKAGLLDLHSHKIPSALGAIGPESKSSKSTGPKLIQGIRYVAQI
jgi:hypothetical protein